MPQRGLLALFRIRLFRVVESFPPHPAGLSFIVMSSSHRPFVRSVLAAPWVWCVGRSFGASLSPHGRASRSSTFPHVLVVHSSRQTGCRLLCWHRAVPSKRDNVTVDFVRRLFWGCTR